MLMEASESLTICETQDGLFTYFNTERSSNCSTSGSIQSLEKSSVARQQNFFLLRSQPITLNLLSLILRTDINRMSSDNGERD